MGKCVTSPGDRNRGEEAATVGGMMDGVMHWISDVSQDDSVMYQPVLHESSPSVGDSDPPSWLRDAS